MLAPLRSISQTSMLAFSSRLSSLALVSAALLAPHVPHVPHACRLRVPPPLLSAGRRALRRQRYTGRAPSPAEQLASAVPAATARPPAPDGPRPSDAAGFVALAATHQQLGQPRKTYSLYAEAVEAGIDPRPVFTAVTRALLKLQRIDLALELNQAHSERSPPDASSAVALMRALCRSKRLDDAAELLASLEQLAPPPAVLLDGAAPAVTHDGADRVESDGRYPLWRAVHSTMRPALALARLRGDDPATALPLLDRMADVAGAAAPPAATLVELTRACGKAKCMGGVYACLEAMGRAGVEFEENHEALQVLCDALVHDVSFVKGGVSMDTLPAEWLPEAAFVGRSNVGKSSLVNMLLGRKAIAYTSKTPGKTQQYNYFVVNPQREGGPGHFHLVDMPGLGFARVPAAQRAAWATFLRRYLVERPQLRLLLHLVDGQVGPVATDEALMKMVAEAQAELARAAPADGAGEWTYTIVLTKMDKRGGKGAAASERKVRRALEQAGCKADVRVVYTSSKSRLGRDDMWRVMRRVVLPASADEEAQQQVWRDDADQGEARS